MISMTPQKFVTQNNGKVIGSGQCGDLIDLWLVEGFGNHTSYAVALDYWTNGIPGFTKVTGVPQDGDIGCYNAHPGYPDGHITMHYQGEEFEQNADPDGSPAHLFPRATTYLLGYLREEINVGVTIQGSPAAVSTSNTRIDVFARGSDNNLWQKYWNGSWQPWVQVGQGIFSDPTVSSWDMNRFDIFATGTDGDLQHWYWPDATGGWSPPESLGTPS